MNDHNLDDLIIGEPDSGKKGGKSLLTLVGLILIILIVGVFLAKLIFGGPETTQESAETELAGIAKPASHTPAAAPKAKATHEAIPEELQPIRRETLPSDQELAPIPARKSAQTSPRHPLPAPSTSAKPKLKPTATAQAKAKPKARKSPKELFAQEKKASKSTPKPSAEKKIYYIQLGSFKRRPEQKFLDKIKAQGYKPLIVKAGAMIKVRVGPYASYADAKAKLPEIKEKLGITGFVVRKK
jgi:DedD protein